MKKINHFSVNDIVQKRKINTLNKKQKQMNNTKKYIQDSNTQINGNEQNQLNQNQILTKIIQQSTTSTKSSPPSFTTQTKSQLLQIISKKLNISLNVSKVLPKIKIKKIQNIEILQKNDLLVGGKKNQNNQGMLSSKKSNTNLIVSGKDFIHGNAKKYSYFILTGSIHRFQHSIQIDQKRKKSSDYFHQQSNQIMFFNWKQFQTEYPEYKRCKTYSQFMGFGLMFNTNKGNAQLSNNHSTLLNQKQLQNINQRDILLSRSNTITKTQSFLIGQDTIYVEIQNPQYQDEYINQTGMEYEKMVWLIQNFSVFNSLGKKIRNFIQFFEFKTYRKNQQVYTIGDPVNKFYLLLKGQIVFQHNKTNPIRTGMNSPTQSKKNSVHIHFTIKTQSVSSGSYFGQQQMLFQIPSRLLTAKCKSSKCQILQIPKQRFQKMLQYSDFYDVVKKSAQIKFKQRLNKLQKNKQIRSRFVLTQFNEQMMDTSKSQDISFINPTVSTQRQSVERKTIGIFNTPTTSKSTSQNKPPNNRFKLMHGNVIRKYSKQQNHKLTQNIQFSMLKVNPDMYQKTMDKFRKYNIKPRQKYIPQINWQLKRVWKILNLENVLRQQSEIGSTEGRKFYDSHKRYMYHLNESKSLRPKTSSSTYRTKMQYIAYLQQFRDIQANGGVVKNN